MRQAGLDLMQLIMDNECASSSLPSTTSGAKPSSALRAERAARSEASLVVDATEGPHSAGGCAATIFHEQPLGSYELFRRSEPLDDAVWDKLMRALDAELLPKPQREFAAAYGIEKSAVSEHFVRTSREKLQALLERPLDKLKALRHLHRRH